MKCTCGTLLGDKQLIYEKELKKIDKNDELYVEKKAKIILNLCERECCRQQLLTYINLIDIIV